MIWFEILRLAMVLTLGKNLWRTSLLFIRDFITMAILNKIKELLVDKVYKINHDPIP